MAKGEAPHSEMAHARQTDGINVVFDQSSPASSRSRSRSSSGSSCSSGSRRHRGRDGHREPCRSSSSSSSSSSRSASHSRSRSYPRCHRRSSRCRCDGHRTSVRGRQHRAPPRRHRARSRSYSRTPSRHRYSDRRRYRSRSRSRRSGGRYDRSVTRFRCRSSRSPARTDRYRSGPRSSGSALSLSSDEKQELLKVAKANAMKILGVEKLELPESVKSILPKQSESKWVSPEARVRQDPEKTFSQSSEVELGVSRPKMSPKRTIAFSINNSVAKPTLAPSSSGVTSRADSYESRKPYGHWIPVKRVQTSNAR